MTITPEKKEPGSMESSSAAPAALHSEESRGFFAAYREDQGRHVRMLAFWSLIFFVGFGCRFLHDLLVQWPSLRAPLGGARIPVVAVDVTPAFLVSAALFCAGALVVHGWLRKPRIADLLIETEVELLKVTWPKGREVWNAAVVVMLSVVLLGLFLALADVFLFRLMRTVILGSG
jgi:preprotein translocase SecE subunit